MKRTISIYFFNGQCETTEVELSEEPTPVEIGKKVLAHLRKIDKGAEYLHRITIDEEERGNYENV
jgi:hypothetical protein